MRLFSRQQFLDALRFNAIVATLVVIVLAGSVGTPVHAQSNLPILGDASEMSIAAEHRLGQRVARELYRDPDYIDDPVLAEYVQGIWQPLLKVAREGGEISPEMDARFPWEVLLGRDRTVNAFAIPGGYFGLHLGLIAVVGSPDELASVLAHELSHVTQRHIARLIAKESKQTPLLIGAMILATVAASKNPQAAEALAVGGQALAIQNQLNFSRDMEREADRLGFSLMEPAGFETAGFVRMFEKLQQASRLNDNGSWPYLRSHPLTSERMSDAQLRVGVLVSAQKTNLNSLAPDRRAEHAMVVARAQVLSNTGADALRMWAGHAQGATFEALTPERQLAAFYGAALAASRLQDVAGANKWLDKLDARVASMPAVRRLSALARADIAVAASQPEVAWRVLSEFSKGSTKSADTDQPAMGRPELLLKAQALTRLKRAPEVTGDLQTWVVTHPQDAAAWQALASAWQASGQVLRSIRAEAEAHAAHYDFAAAVDRLKAGQLMARTPGKSVDFIEASIIDTRLRALELLLREQAAER
jgi:predicted Zn-dependent protease